MRKAIVGKEEDNNADKVESRILHFTLFVLSCISVHRLRRRKRLSRIHPNLHNTPTANTIDPMTAQRNIELQYHRSPEEHAAKSPSIPPAYISGVPSSLHRHEGKLGSGHSFDSGNFDPDHGATRFDKDLEVGRNPFGDEQGVDNNEGSKTKQPPRDRIEGAIKYM